MIDLTHYTIEARGGYQGVAYLEAECDRCPRWYLPGLEHSTLPLAELVRLLECHERQAHETPAVTP